MVGWPQQYTYKIYSLGAFSVKQMNETALILSNEKAEQGTL